MVINCGAIFALQLIMQKQFIMHNIMADEATPNCICLTFFHFLNSPAKQEKY